MTTSLSGGIDRPKKASLIKIRLIIAIMGSLCPIVCYIGRQNLSMAIISMVNNTEPSIISTITSNSSIIDVETADIDADTIGTSLSSTLSSQLRIQQQHNLQQQQLSSSSSSLSSSTSSSFNNNHSIRSALETCPHPTIVGQDGQQIIAPKTMSYGPKYNWESSERGLVFETFFITYVICQIPGARVAEKLGAKWVLASAAMGTSVLNLLSPWAASVHVYAFAFVRLLMGIFQAALYPACYVLYSNWLPPLERPLALPILGAGAYVGSIIASTSTGYFSEQPTLGWEFGFYMPSALCAIWSILWLFLGSSEPRQNRFISLEEIDYIETRMEIKKAEFEQKKDISWYKIVTSRSIWAMMAAFLASNWSFTIVFLLLPSYLNDILHIPPFKNGIINSIIYVLNCVSAPIVGALSAIMVETRSCGLNRLQIRKLFQCTALFGQTVCFIAVPLIGCDTYAVLGILYTQIVLFSLVNGGEVQMPSELSIDFAGTIYAIGNSVGSSTGFIIPRLHSWMVQNSHDRSQWNAYFYLAAIVTALGGLIFLLFGKNDLQDFSEDFRESKVNICQAVRCNRELSLNIELSKSYVSGIRPDIMRLQEKDQRSLSRSSIETSVN